jgi:hypothetical protein
MPTDLAPPAVAVVDPVLVLGEFMTRLRAAGVPMSSDRLSLDDAYGYLTALLGALGVPVDGAELAEADWLLLRCVAARR